MDLTKPRFRFETIDKNTLEFFLPFEFTDTANEGNPFSEESHLSWISLKAQLATCLKQSFDSGEGLQPRRHLFLDPHGESLFPDWAAFTERYEIGELVHEEFAGPTVLMGRIQRNLQPRDHGDDGFLRALLTMEVPSQKFKGQLEVIYEAAPGRLFAGRSSPNLPAAGIMGHYELIPTASRRPLSTTAQGTPPRKSWRKLLSRMFS